MRTTIGLFVILLASPAFAATLYVSPTGNDSVTKAQNSATTPWRTLCRATNGATSCARGSAVPAQAAQAGDVVEVAAGTYTGDPGDRFWPSFNPANSGTAAAPIVFRCTGVCVGVHVAGRQGPVFGASQRHYITWQGAFTAREATAPSAPDTGAIVIVASRFVTLDGLVAVGGGSIGRGDNYPGIRLEEATDVTIRNVEISAYDGEGGTNSPCIQLYRSGRVLIEHSFLHHCAAGVTLKGTAEPTWRDVVTVRLNRIEDMRDSGIEVHRTGPVPYVLFTQNVVRRVGEMANVKQWDADTTTGPRNLRAISNTGIGLRNGCWKLKGDPNAGAPNGHVYANNICADGPGAFFEDASPSTVTRANYAFDRNLYANTGGWSLSGWQTDFPGQDVGSASVNPQFVSATDARLQPGSPARTLGRAVYGVGGADGTTIPVGAYITGAEVIGPGGSTPPQPTPVDCAGTWGTWTRQTGSETACVASTRTFIERRLFTVVTPASNGGAACPASPESRTAAEACTMPPTPPADLPVRLDCTHIESITRTTDAGGYQRWIVRGTCVPLTGGAVRGPGQ